MEVSQVNSFALTAQEEAVVKGIFALPSLPLFRRTTELKKNFQAQDRGHVMEGVFREVLERSAKEDPIALLDRLADVVSLDALETSEKELLQEVRQRLREAEIALLSARKIPPSLRAHAQEILQKIVALLEALLATFGASELLKPTDSEIMLSFKAQQLMMLLSLFGALAGLLAPIVGSATAGIILGSIFLGITLLGVLWPSIRPKPSTLPAFATNWTQEVRKNRSSVDSGRKEILNQMALAIEAGRHPLLVGESRTGKSIVAKAFAAAIERGDYPSLKGKVVFRINTPDLTGQQASFLGGGNDILQRISDAMGRHRKEIVLVLDEVHMACKNGEKISDQLKTFLDQGGEFPHVIGITTSQEFQDHIQENPAFANRFVKIDIESMGQGETLRILAETALKDPSRPSIAPGMLEQIYGESGGDGETQPYTALNLLKERIAATQKSQASRRQQALAACEKQVLALEMVAAATHTPLSPGERQQVEELERQSDVLRQEIAAEETRRERLLRAKELLDTVEHASYVAMVKLAAVAQTTLNRKTEREVKLFCLMERQFRSFLIEYIKQESHELGMKLII